MDQEREDYEERRVARAELERDDPHDRDDDHAADRYESTNLREPT